MKKAVRHFHDSLNGRKVRHDIESIKFLNEINYLFKSTKKQ